VGCEDGFYTIPLAAFLGPSGKVFAEDINDAALIKLKEHLIKEGLKNVEVIKSVEDDPKLPPERLGAALIINSYREMTAKSRAHVVSFIFNLHHRKPLPLCAFEYFDHTKPRTTL
jgi:hypothetical protein